MRERQGLAAQLDRPVQRAQQRRRDLTHPRVGADPDMVGYQLRARQYVAEIVIDLGDRRPERGEARALPQRLPQRALHRREFAARPSDLVRSRAGGDRIPGVFGIGAERDHAFRDAQHRPDEEKLEADIDQRRGDQRNDDRKEQDPFRIAQHLVSHGRFVDHRPNYRFGVLGRRADDLDYPVPAAPQDQERLPDQREESRFAQVVDFVDLGRGLADKRLQFGCIAADYAVRAGMFEDFSGQPRGHGAALRRSRRQRGQVGGGDPFLHVDQAIAPDRRRINEHLAQHHEKNRQHEQARR